MNGEIALMVMSHGLFAKAAMESLELVIGKQNNYDTMAIQLVDNVDALKAELFEKVDKLDKSKGLVVFADIVGGTPMNLAGNLLGRENVILCSGFNLPVLLEFSLNRGRDFSEIRGVIEHAYSNGMSLFTNDKLKEEEEDDLLL
ncbi:PTS sugar transporter subunit IIA [Lacrimispora sp.]|uniref:PTS sugar transporter subunit IIA n=1 Tax=Lacrimispora sp. TaxID=2719234 RepID=UPI0034614EEA